MKPRFFRLGEAAVSVQLGGSITPSVNARVHALARKVAAVPPPGLIETVPAYCSLTLHYDPAQTSFSQLKEHVAGICRSLSPLAAEAGQLHEIPVAYGGEFGPDLEAVADETGLDRDRVVSEHCRRTYRVYMVGFAPGFPYLGLTSARLQAKRLPTPRKRVPPGSVAIAGRQTGLYPQETPGGWRILGRTGWRFFDPQRLPPSRLQPMDQVRFRPASSRAAGLVGKAAGPAWGRRLAAVKERGRPLARVLDGGLLTTVQDLGRFGFQSAGVPVSGAMDRFALRAANTLVNNLTEAPGLEIALIGPRLQFLDDALIAVCGADLAAELEQPDGSAWPLPGWMAALARRGTTLRFGSRRSGCRAYLAIAGGVAVPPVLGSASTYLSAGLGGFQGRKLLGGDILRGNEISADAVFFAGHIWPESLRPPYGSAPTVRVMPGPQWREFGPQAQRDFLGGEYTVLADSNRVGLRLSGSPVRRSSEREVISCGVAEGSVQVPSDGQPIVLGADRQTVGGYPQLAVAIGPDLPLLAQLVPGDRVRFQRVTPAEADAALRAERVAFDTARIAMSQADPDIIS